ncbi:MAG: TrmH family RNA methyltransferase [Cyanobacteria bacterium J06621_11]
MTQISFILVEPGEAGNIGAAARAMNTMGYSDLRLVRPKADPLSGLAKAMAHGSAHILESAPVYEQLADALSDIDFACGTTARHRIEKYHYVSVRELHTVLAAKGETLNQVAIVFGSERSGLSNQDINLCDIVTNIPQVSLQPSLNLSQAVMIYSFVLAQQQTQIQIADQRLNQQEMPVEQYAKLKASLQQVMAKIGLSERYQRYVIQAIARLGYEDLYLIQNIRTMVDKQLSDRRS